MRFCKLLFNPLTVEVWVFSNQKFFSPKPEHLISILSHKTKIEGIQQKPKNIFSAVKSTRSIHPTNDKPNRQLIPSETALEAPSSKGSLFKQHWSFVECYHGLEKIQSSRNLRFLDFLIEMYISCSLNLWQKTCWEFTSLLLLLLRNRRTVFSFYSPPRFLFASLCAPRYGNFAKFCLINLI